MGTENGTPEGARWRQLSSFVAQQLWAGTDPGQVVRDLQDQGLDHTTALALVEAVEEGLRQGGAL